MKTVAFAVATLLVVSPALADEQTVTLTQSELQAIVTAQVAQALAQAETQRAAPALKKVQEVFAPTVRPYGGAQFAAPAEAGAANLTPPGVTPK